MRRIILVAAAFPMLSGCIVGTVAKTAVDVATIPVKVASAGVNAVLPSQRKEDEKRGREARKQDEQRGKQIRMAMERCQQGRPAPGDDCSGYQPR